MIISDELVFNLIKDFEKRDISREDKAQFISDVLEYKKCSLRSLSNQLHIPLGTLHEWKTMNKWRKSQTDDGIVSNGKCTSRRFKKNEDEIKYLADRLTFLLSRPFKADVKVMERIKTLKAELDKLDVVVL